MVPVVERSTKVLIFEPWITPLAPSAVSCTTWGLGRLANTSSQASATSLAVEARWAPRSVRIFTAESLRSITVRV